MVGEGGGEEGPGREIHFSAAYIIDRRAECRGSNTVQSGTDDERANSLELMGKGGNSVRRLPQETTVEKISKRAPLSGIWQKRHHYGSDDKEGKGLQYRA